MSKIPPNDDRTAAEEALLSEGHHLPIKKNLWQRWMSWSGSFFVISLLVHILLIGGATVLVVQVIQGKKEKLQFTARPPTPAAPAEHKVKPTKKTASAAPAITKRITSTAVNASVALPPIDLSSSAAPDLMSGVMSGMGAGGLGMGSGGAGAGMAAMPVAGLTAFGFKGTGATGGLKGEIYDLKQTPDHQPTGIIDEGLFDQVAGGWKPSVMKQIEIFNKLFSSTDGSDPDRGWDDSILKSYYKAKDSVVAYQVMVPYMQSTEGPKSFGVDKEIPKACHWLVLYKGTVVAPRDGQYRFIGFADDQLAVRFNGQNVMLSTLQSLDKTVTASFNEVAVKNAPKELVEHDPRLSFGKWFSVSAGNPYPIEILIAEMPGGQFTAQLYIEERYPEKPYPHRTFPGAEKYLAYPIFQLKKGFAPPDRKAVLTPPPNAAPAWRPSETYREIAPDPVIFTGR